MRCGYSPFSGRLDTSACGVTIRFQCTIMTISAFFYGTLLHPKVLKRVIGNDGSHLTICPAVLLVCTYYYILYGLKVWY